MAKLEQIDDSNQKLKQNNRNMMKKTNQGLTKVFVIVDYIFLVAFLGFLCYILVKFLAGL